MAAAGTFVTAKLMRTDNQTPWGFRLQGGQEFNIPLAMGKVRIIIFFNSNNKHSHYKYQLMINCLRKESAILFFKWSKII